MSDDPYHFSFGLDSWLTSQGISAYDSVSAKDGDKNRRAKQHVNRLEDTNLWQQQRQTAIATSQDMERNFATVAWAIRKHLDYVSALSFTPATGDREFDRQLSQWYERWGTRFNCDVRQRHSMRRMIRLAEARRVVDGDVFFAKVGGNGGNRGKIQPIESYRIHDPFLAMSTEELRRQNIDENERDRWHNGVRLNRDGSAGAYAVFSRDINGNSKFERVISARQVCSVGYYTRFDQVRGISPLLSGLQTYIDCSDNISMHQAKMRISALFGLSLYRDADFSEDQHGGPVATEDSDADGTEDAGYQFDFSGGPQLLDLSPGDRAEFLESRTPPAEVVDFLRFMLNIALKTLDLPDSFLREGETNFFGSRAALQLYLRACADKQQDLTEFLDEIMRWRIGMAIADADLLPPRGMQFEDIRWKWHHTGFPWAWDPLKEAKAAKEAIELGADNPINVAMRNGTDAFENKRITEEFYADWNVQLPWLNKSPMVEPEMSEEDEDERIANQRNE